MDQSEMEWGLVLRGSAQLRFQGDEGMMDLSPGDHFFIPPHRLHRVERSDPDPGTLWLALYWHCLLYTSPSPRDLSTSRMPSSA